MSNLCPIQVRTPHVSWSILRGQQPLPSLGLPPRSLTCPVVPRSIPTAITSHPSITFPA